MKTLLNGQSPDSQDVDEMPAEKVAEWLKRDIGVALTLLNALYSDWDMLVNMAVFLQGRYTNAKNQEKLKDEES